MFRLLLLFARRDRIQVPVWIIGGALLAYTSASAVGAEVGPAADRTALLRVAVGTPSILALRGVPDGPSLGSYVFFQSFVYLAIVAALMSVFLVTRHTRADEEQGRLELLGAAPVGRTAGLWATVLLGVIANVLIGAAVGLAYAAGGLSVGGAWFAGLAVAAVGACFVGLTALLAQLLPTSRAVNGTGSALVGLAFVLRAAGDALGTPTADGLSVVSAWPSWLSPIGWGQQTFAFTATRPAPLLLAVGLVIVTVAAAVAVQSSRDLGSSLVRERDGRVSGRAGFRSNRALVWRLHWPTVVGWAVGGVVMGLLAGGLAASIASGLAADSSISKVVAGLVPGGKGGIADLFVAAVMSLAGVLAAAAGVQAMLRGRSEEADGRAELVLAAPVSRTVWLLDYVIVAVVSVVVVSAAAGLAAGLAFLGSGAGADRFWSSLGAGLAQIPAALVYIAVTALLFAVLPRLTIWAAWALLALGVVVGQMGGLLHVPQRVRDASPFVHTPALPAGAVDWSGAWVLVIVAIVLVAGSTILIRRRELTT